MAEPRLPAALECVRIEGLPATAYYVADFLTEDEERHLLQKVAAAPKPRWKQLSHRRLQTWPSDLLRDTLLDAPLPAWLTDPVVTRLLALPVRRPGNGGGGTDGEHASVFAGSPHQRPNHVLINEYPPGVGIMPHKDGSAYHSVVCTVSLGASLCLSVYQNKDDDGTLDPEPVARILQEPRSLLITTDRLYTDYLHGIADVAEDVDLGRETVANWDLLRSADAVAAAGGRNPRQTRVSLTYRDVLRVSKLGTKLFNARR